jgi:hypothetical protein
MFGQWDNFNFYIIFSVRFQVLTTTNMKMAVFWDIAPCALVFDRRFKGAYCDLPDDRGSKHLWNVGKYLPDNAAQHPRRQQSSLSLLFLFCSKEQKSVSYVSTI